mgnify:CR=1 FL=1
MIGVRLELDRITIVQTDIKAREIYSDYQWNREGIPKVLETVRHFDKEDFSQYLMILMRMGCLFYSMIICNDIPNQQRRS